MQSRDTTVRKQRKAERCCKTEYFKVIFVFLHTALLRSDVSTETFNTEYIDTNMQINMKYKEKL